jgi:hypothetical protein
MKKDPWGSVALGLTVAAGVGLLFVPGGQAIGAGILIGVALSGGAGIATGTFDPRVVAFNGVIGGITGGVGSAFSGAGIATQVAVGAVTGAGGSAAQQEVFTGHVDWGQVGISAAVGGAGGGAGAMLGKLAAARSVNAGADSNYVNLASPQRTAHILEGEQLPTGDWSGGHAWPGAPGKTPFPKDWSNARIMHEVSDIATDPKLQWVQQTGPKGSMYTNAGNPARFTVAGERGGVTIKVVLEPAGEGIITAHPIPTGP